MNKVLLVGNLTKDLELRKLDSGTSVLRFTVAISRRVASGQEPQADFVSCVAWNKQAELMAQYLHKGSKVGVEGRIRTGSYDRDGQKVYTTDVVAEHVEFLSPKTSQPGGDYQVPTYDPAPNYPSQPEYEEPLSLDAFDPSSEDLPF